MNTTKRFLQLDQLSQFCESPHFAIDSFWDEMIEAMSSVLQQGRTGKGDCTTTSTIPDGINEQAGPAGGTAAN